MQQTINQGVSHSPRLGYFYRALAKLYCCGYIHELPKIDWSSAADHLYLSPRGLANKALWNDLRNRENLIRVDIPRSDFVTQSPAEGLYFFEWLLRLYGAFIFIYQDRDPTSHGIPIILYNLKVDAVGHCYLSALSPPYNETSYHNYSLIKALNGYNRPYYTFLFSKKIFEIDRVKKNFNDRLEQYKRESPEEYKKLTERNLLKILAEVASKFSKDYYGC